MTDIKDYPTLAKYTHLLDPLDFETTGREHEIERIQSTFDRKIVSNVFLLGDAGVGKTTLVRAMIDKDKQRRYLEVNLPSMTVTEGDGDNVDAVVSRRIQDMLDEIQAYGDAVRESEDNDTEIILFIDEIHLLFKLSPSGVEAMKPALADSVKRHIRVVVATTFEEYEKHKINDNLPWIERFVFIRLYAPSDEQVFDILKMTAKQHLCDDEYDDQILRQIVEYTNRYQPASSQPRKSIMMLDAMLGVHAYNGRPMDIHLLADSIYDTVGVKIAQDVDASTVRDYLNNRVYSQELAIDAIYKQLNIVIADIHDKSRPLLSALLTGDSGTGKTELVKACQYIIFKRENDMVRLNMSEFSTKESVVAFRYALTSGVSRKPYTIVLIDEVEKAHPDATRLLLQVLDDGMLSDSNGREVSFKNTMIIATTNVGSNLYGEIAHHIKEGRNGKARALAEYKPLIKSALMDDKSFPNELINRFDAFVPFNSLDLNTKKRIARTKLYQLATELRTKHSIHVHYGPEIVDWLVIQKEDNNARGGARGIANTIKDDLTSAIAEAINMGRLETDDKGRKSLFIAVDPDVTVDDISEKRDIAAFTPTLKYDNTAVYVGSRKVAAELSAKNEITLKRYYDNIERNRKYSKQF